MPRFLPEPVTQFLWSRLHDAWAICLCLCGLFLLLSLMFYNAADPSWNTSVSLAEGTAGVGNIMGAYGAHLSDLFLQIFGFAAFIPACVLTIWGGYIYAYRELKFWKTKAVCMALATCALSIAFARISVDTWLVTPYMGGLFGSVLLNNLAYPFYSLLGGWEYTAVATASGVLGIWMLALAIPSGLIEIMQNNVGHMGVVGRYAYAAVPPIVNAWSFIQNMMVRVIPAKNSDISVPDVPAKKTVQVAEPKPKQLGKVKIADRPKSSAAKKQQSMRFTGTSDTDWEFPPNELLALPPENVQAMMPDESTFRQNAEMLQSVLEDFNVSGQIVKIHPGPVVTLYEFEPAPGTKTSRVVSLSDDIARSMAALSVRVAVIPGRNVIGIELPNLERQTVYFREVIEAQAFQKTSAKLPLILGKDIGGHAEIADLTRMPHLLVAGTTGSGKSVSINTMILSLLYCLPPEKCRFLMIDPKMLELSVYQDIPHLLTPVVTDPGKAVVALKWVVQEMENRYRSMSKLGVRNIEGYNARLREAKKKGEVLMRKVQTGFDPDTGKPVFEEQPLDLTELPYIVVVVDEFADLMLVAGKDIENAIQRLAQMARAAGIHLIMATQRPSVDVITGVVKANFPTRISFQVTSKIDSRTILGESGAEQLLGMGDMLYMAPGGRLKRVHGPFVSDKEVEQVANFLKSQGEPAYLDDVTDGDGDFGDNEVLNAMFGSGGSSERGADTDELYDQAVAIVARERKASTSFIQRHLQIGYNRAARIVEQMEKEGVISPANHVGKREVLVGDYSEV